MSIRRVALIFDNLARPETTGVYCRRALEQLVEVEHFLPTELHQIPRDGFDLYLNIDDGLHYRLPEHLRPCAWWAIDTHLDFDWCRDKAQSFDRVFTAQHDGAERLQRAGLPASWLPLACDPEIHRPHRLDKEWDVCFIGNLLEGERADLLRLIQQHYDKTFVGQRYFEEMARTYSQSKTAFNRSIRNDINMRVFEAMACGTLLLTNDLFENGQPDLYQDGVHCATYRTPDELLEKLRFYLSHDVVRERVSRAGQAEVHNHHTYWHRMHLLLSDMERHPPAAAVAVAAPHSPTQSTQPNTDPVPEKPPESPGRETDYYDFARPELLERIPPSAKRILDVGCANGRLGEAIKTRQDAEVIGIEMNPSAAAAARTRLDRVLVGDVETLDSGFAEGEFDAIICGDVLEHLREPAAFLKRSRSWLRPNGVLVTSVPNVRNQTVIRALLDGNWTYEPAGLLDRDHLRFFTRREIEKLCFRCGLSIKDLAIVPGPGYAEWVERGRPNAVEAGRLRIGGLPPGDVLEFYAYQYLVTATPAPVRDLGLTSIVILTHNQLEYTRQCLASIRQYTDEPYELIVIDNASTDGTPHYLAAQDDVTLIRNDSNRGFPAACNQGIQVARGSQILLLNNDTVVTTGWLRRMLEAMYRDPSIGLVGPCSNCVSGEQQIPVSYDDLGSLDGFAWNWGKQNHCVLQDTDRLVGFCLLIRRELIDRIGVLDEQFGIGCYEDDDYCRRALQAGFRAVIARDAFIHHFGSRTFIGSAVDFGKILEENRERFEHKWTAEGKPAAIAPPATPTNPHIDDLPPPLILECGADGKLQLAQEEPLISLCMIVRDNAKTLGPCLESIKPCVDEMIVVDTGSIDNTPVIAERLGARVFHSPWQDSFSTARNESLRHARGRWIFWMDSDDTITPENGRKLRALAQHAADPSILGYVAQVHCPGPGPVGHLDVTIVDHVKLFRNRPDLRFTGRIHEQILPAIRAAGGEVAWTDLFVTHSGVDHSPSAQERKNERDLKLLNLELQEQPNHPFTLFNLGMTYADIEQFNWAIDSLQQSIRSSGANDSHLRKAYALLVYSQNQTGDAKAAESTCAAGLALFPDDLELRFRKGLLLHQAGKLSEAAATYEDVLRNPGERCFSSVVQGMRSFMTRHNLAVVYQDQGNFAAAEQEWLKIVQEVPDYGAGWRGLGDLLLQQGRIADAISVTSQIPKGPGLQMEWRRLRSRIAAAQNQHDQARHELEAALRECPDDIELKRIWAEFLFQRGDLTAAESALRELIAVEPNNAAHRHNLGMVLGRWGDARASIPCFEKSLQLRPRYAATLKELGFAYRSIGHTGKAVAVWQQAIQQASDDVELRQALAEAQRSMPWRPMRHDGGLPLALAG